MELNKFITETIVQISKGISGAQEELKESGCLVSPKNVFIKSNGDKILQRKGDTLVQDIEINVAITDLSEDGGKAGIGVAAGFFGGGVQTNNNNSNQVVSTVKFSIPIVFPTVDTPEGFMKSGADRA